MAHNNGVFPLANGDSVTKAFEKHKKDLLWKGVKIKKKMLTEFEHSKVSLPIDVQDFQEDYMFHSLMKKSCPVGWQNIKKRRHNFLKDYVNKISYYKGLFEENGLIFNQEVNYSKLKKLTKKMKERLFKIEPKVKNFSEFSKWFDVINSYLYYNNVNFLFDDDVFEKLKIAHSANAFSYFLDDDMRKFASDKIVRTIEKEMRRRMDMIKVGGKRKENNGIKYLGFSGNDWNIGSLLLGFGLASNTCNLQKMVYNKTLDGRDCRLFPNYANNFIFELSEKEGKFYVRVKENGKLVQFCPSGEEYCPFDIFKNYLVQNLYSFDNAEICVKPKIKMQNKVSNFPLIFMILVLAFVMVGLNLDIIKKRKAHLE